MSSPVYSVVSSVCGASSDAFLGDGMWRTVCCPCSTFPLSISLIDPNVQRNCYGLAPVQSQELPERGCGQQLTHLGDPTPDFSSMFTPELSLLKYSGTYNWHPYRSMVVCRHRHLGICVYVPQITSMMLDHSRDQKPFFILPNRLNTISFANWMPR